MKFLPSALMTLLAVCFLTGSALAQSKTEINNLKKQVKSGDARAMYRLGVIYEKQQPESRWLKRAFELYSDAANLNVDSAQFAVARLYENGRGTSQSYPLAMRYYQSAADQNHADACMATGRLFETGAGGTTPRDVAKAASYYLKAKQLKHPEAQQKLEMLPPEAFVDKNAPAYVLFMAEKGDPESQYKAGKLYLSGTGIAKDEYQAFNYFRAAADKNYAPANFELGKIYATGLTSNKITVNQNLRLALSNYLKAANNGVTEADQEIKKYDLSLYLPTDDPDVRMYRLRQGTGNENSGQKYEMYQRYLTGNGVPQDVNRALEFLQGAARDKHLPAMMTVASMYDRGYLLPMSAENSFLWYREAAIAGSDSAKMEVANRYAIGRGTPVNTPEAVRWYLRLASSESAPLSAQARAQLQRYNIGDYVAPTDLDFLSYQAINGNSVAQMQVAEYYFKQDDPQALRWLRLAADNQQAPAARMLGDVYLYGKCKQIPNERDAAKWYYQAAQANDLEAMKSLAFMFSQNMIKNEGNNYQRAKELTDKYLALTSSNPQLRDKFIYKVVGDIQAVNNDFKGAILNYTDFINSFDIQKHRPIDVIAAMDTRAISFYNLGDLNSCLNDLEICMLQLEQFKSSPDVQAKYLLFKSVLHYRIGRVSLEQGNQVKACDNFRQSARMGIQVEARYLAMCGN